MINGGFSSPILFLEGSWIFMERTVIPQHVAIIMDGNGRWAKERNLPRYKGHLEGVNRVDEIVEASSDLGVKVLTLFAFSTENWNRPADEVSMLMKTLCSVLERKLVQMAKENLRLMSIGQRQGVPPDVLQVLDNCAEKTKDNTGMILNLAFNYGARAEILTAVRRVAEQVKAGTIEPQNIDETFFSRQLFTKDLPDPDLLIRTSGEQRISNFLLWQLSYAELYFTDVYWPDFTVDRLREAVEEYSRRERRYGKTTEQIVP